MFEMMLLLRLSIRSRTDVKGLEYISAPAKVPRSLLHYRYRAQELPIDKYGIGSNAKTLPTHGLVVDIWRADAECTVFDLRVPACLQRLSGVHLIVVL